MTVFSLVNTTASPVLVQGIIIQPGQSVKVTELGDGTEDKILQGVLTCSPSPHLPPSYLATNKTTRTITLEEGQVISPFKSRFITDLTPEIKDLEAAGILSISPESNPNQAVMGTYLPTPHLLYSVTKEIIEV